jgi:nucleotide-binding universal stress UspA family protein
MKTILVLTGGGEMDPVVFDTALVVAQPLGAHLEFLHIRLSPGQAAAFTPHVEFAQGAALRDALERLEAEATASSAAAALHCRQFCERRAIVIADSPSASEGVSATWHEERDDAIDRLMLRARHNDLVVLGRPSHANGLPPDLIELLAIGCGRPVLVAPPRMPHRVAGTVLVCWKENATTARALGAALPLLSRSKRVVIVGVEEAGERTPDGMRDLAAQLRWHGISAEHRWMPAARRTVAQQIEAAAADCAAELLVMGAYGHSRTREKIFGGCTQHFIDHAERPVLLMH